MSGIFEDVLKGAAEGFFGNPYLRDYTHASKTFRPNSYQYAPKFKFLFHTYFEINPQAYGQNISTNANFGLLVKSVKLPSFNFEVATMNQYNRKRLVQSKIKYDSVDITFHDDHGTAVNTPNAGGYIRSLWKAYYNYYYADGSRPQVVLQGQPGTPPRQYTGAGGYAFTNDATYNSRNQYKPSITGNDSWGYLGETPDPSGAKIPFFKQITIYGLSQHNAVAYTLINPVITKFSHDTYDYAQGNGIMEHQMSLEYETVVYNEIAIDGTKPDAKVPGFGANETYDRTLSPLSRPGSQANILGPSGLLDAAGGIINNLTPDENGQINLLGAIQTAGTTYNTFKNVNLGQLAQQEVVSGLTGALSGTPNRNVNVLTPVFGAAQNLIGTAGAALSKVQVSPTKVGGPNNAGTG